MGQLDLESGINTLDLYQERLRNILGGLLEYLIRFLPQNPLFCRSCDGYQIFKQKTDDCWLFLIINNNLHPSLRVKKENLLIPFLIPGLNQPKDFNTFLRPFVDEMKELESKNFIIFVYY
jgi:hypothetical protein